MNTSQPLIRQWQNRPPNGGWNLSYEYKNQVFRCTGTPYAIVAKIKEIQKINKAYRGDDLIWDYCNSIWQRRDPARAIKERVVLPTTPKPKSKSHFKTAPGYYGSIMWEWMNMFGTIFDESDWKMTLQRVLRFLDPVKSPDTGCEECFNEFTNLLAQYPPEVHNEEEAARWVHKIHNIVNKRIGKPLMRFEDAARKFSWRVEI